MLFRSAGYACPVLADSYEALDRIVESAAEAPGRRVLVDLAAQTHEPLVQWIDESGVLELAAENGLSLHYWHVMDSGRDSVDLLAKLLDHFGPRLNYVLVRNALRGDDFGMLDKSGQQARAQALGAQVIALKHLHDPVVQKIDSADASFWAARHNTDKSGPGLGLMERQRLKTWLAHANAELDRLSV